MPTEPTLTSPAAGLPPPAVLTAFGLTGEPVPLTGGQGQSVRVGAAVLKPAGSTAETEWAARVTAAVHGRPGFRVPRALRTASGGYVSGGWSAAEFLTGEPGPAGRWEALLRAGRSYHRALREAPRPADGLLESRRHPWAVADRVAWGGEAAAPVTLPTEVRGLLRDLWPLLRPVDLPEQLVHGDLTGNVLFAPGLPPAVIDFSPYWRPEGYADAIVAVDGMLYHGAGPGLAAVAAPGPEGPQLLLRALIFRLLAGALLEEPGGTFPAQELARFARVARLLG